jgi:hypothetical protein
VSRFYGTCEKCGQPVTSERDRPAYPVQGWEVQREEGGANAIRNRQRIPGRVRHETCLPNPINEAQERLI